MTASLFRSVLGCVLLFPTLASAQFDEEGDFPPGLLARYSASGRTVERIDPDVSFVWNDSAPDPRLPAGPFNAEWTSLLLVRQDGQYRIHAYLQGEAAVQIDGKTVLTGRRSKPGWISGAAFPMSFGEKSFHVTFRKTSPAARLQLFWSSDHFELEPLPPQLLFRDEGRPELAAIERGRILYDAHRCNRCHQRENQRNSLPAPALATVATGGNADWLVHKLLRPSDESPHARMPDFGFNEKEARAVAAFLWHAAEKTQLSTPKRLKEKDRAKETRRGEILLRSVGCLACHQVGELGSEPPYGGGDLSRIGSKRSYAWLYTWLGNPGKLNPDHRMPVFQLRATERRQLALALSARVDENASTINVSLPADQELIATGRRLVEAARCAACHRIPGVELVAAGLPDLSQPVDDWSKSCLATTADRSKNRPAYPSIDRDAIIAFVKSRTGMLSKEGPFALGKHVLERNNCLACHERDQTKGIRAVAGTVARTDSDLNGQSEALIPPALTAVGDKLRDAALAEAVSGEQKQIRLPWLRVRMPRFAHPEPEKAALLAHLIGHDRIPDGAPVANAVASAPKSTDAQTLVLGQTLVGAKGFSCVACHKIGEYEPKNVALGTRGSDLMMLDGRMRKSYFLRWTRSPLRIVPGMEMPSYSKPVPRLLGGDVAAQLETMWNALNDPRFKPPTNPAVVEQYLFVKDGAPARIVRDVFTNPKENGGGAVARALAVGFHNGHSALFDLDTLTLRQWTFGDMARQRTIGKSWYWDMAGVPVVVGFAPDSDYVLRRQESGEMVAPHKEFGTTGQLLGYHNHQDGVRFTYELNFEIDGARQTVQITETLQPTTSKGDHKRTGWERQIAAAGVPQGYQLYVARPIPKSSVGSPSITRRDDPAVDWQLLPEDGPRREFVRLAHNGTNATGTLRYSAELRRDSLEFQEKPQPAPTATPVRSAPGFDGVQLPLDASIMPTAITWLRDGTLAFCSLKGHVFLAHDTDGDGLEDRLTVFEEGLAAPYGLIADGNDLIVAHKPELLRLSDTDGDGRADKRTVVATGWGYNDNYHDWTTGIIRDSQDNLYIGLGSDYAQKGRPREQCRWRGKVLRVSPDGRITPVAHAFRYPTGLAITSNDEIFVTDNQGVQNCFNEINYIEDGRHYGVPSLYEDDADAPPMRAAVQVPHPWTRSVNGLFMLPDQFPVSELGGHGVGCEYNSRLLVRFTHHRVGDSVQGAVYYLTLPAFKNEEQNFLGPICGAVSPRGEIYIGSIHDSGWLGGLNTGSIVRLTPNGRLPNGIRELRAVPGGFELEFMAPIDKSAASDVSNYSISGYTRVWEGGYATPDSGRYRVNVKSVEVSPDGRTATLRVDELRENYVYEVSCGDVGKAANIELWPDTGHYTMNRVPAATSTEGNSQ